MAGLGLPATRTRSPGLSILDLRRALVLLDYLQGISAEWQVASTGTDERNFQAGKFTQQVPDPMSFAAVGAPTAAHAGTYFGTWIVSYGTLNRWGSHSSQPAG